MAFTVLVVCTGNICRSPVAERLLRRRIPAGWPVQVFSAGTSAVVGADIDRPSAYVLREYGIEPDRHVARRVTGAMVGAADLVLTAEQTHRSRVVQSEPMAFRRAFTLREFARLGAAAPPWHTTAPTEDELRERVTVIGNQRGVVEPPEDGGDDIGDPFGGDVEVARACVARIAAAVDDVVRALGADVPTRQATST